MADFFAKGNKPINGYGGVDEGVIYSTEEHIIGKWIDGSTLYEKTVDFGLLTNSSAKTIPHGISNLRRAINFDGIAYADSSEAYQPLEGQFSHIYIIGNNISVSTTVDMSSWSAYITLRYTKTS